MNTKDAWLKMICTPGVEERLGIATRTRDGFRSQARNQNKYPSLDTMIRQLQAAGYVIAQELMWEGK